VTAHAEEGRVDPGSDPGRDEYELPPVDVQIPDDARDLDRDVLAYRRELRAKRRHMRISKLAAPAIRHGMVIPLVAACLALTLLAGTLLTVLAGRQIPLPAPGTSQRASPPHARRGQLPDVQVFLENKQVRLRSLAFPAVLAWVPPGCDCAGELRQLAKQAASAHLHMYLVGTDGTVAPLTVLARQAHIQVVDDTLNALGRAYHLKRPAAILRHSDGSVGDGDVLRRLPPASQLGNRFRSLAGASQAPAPQAS
jgi:hypothetical protein